MSMKKLYDTLSSISAGQKSGNLVIVAIEGLSKRLGTCIISKGKLVQATFQQQTGRAAISALLAFDIDDVNFMEFPTTAEPHPDIPTIIDLLQKIKAKQVKDKTQQTLGIDLQNEVIQLLEKRFGASATNKVSAVAQNISPIEQPLAFLDKCKSLIEIMSGKEKAEKMFAQLYEKIKNQ